MAEYKQLQKQQSNSQKNLSLNQPFLDYVGIIVSAATLAPPGAEVDTAIQCIRRPGKKRCHGLIRLHLQENPAELNWWCPVCADNGVIHNWKGTPGHLSHTRVDDKFSGGEFCEVLLNVKEYSLLSEIAIYEPAAEEIVRDAVTVENGTLILGTIEGMNSLLGYIAFESSHEQRTRRQQILKRLFDKISHTLEGSI